MAKLTKKFYQGETLDIAKKLLGKYIIRNYQGNVLAGKIVETEAYIGFDDKACHASKGKTYRNEVMFECGGCAYIYMIYGMYYCLNIVTDKKDFPAAVLIRAIEPISGVELMNKNREIKDKKLEKLCNGPGKLCQALKIDRKLNGCDLKSKDLWLEDKGLKITSSNIVSRKRIGVDYARPSKNLLWRFYLKDNNYVSKK